MKKGDRLYFKGKYDMYYEVEVKSVEGDYATVRGSIAFGTHKVRTDKLFKEPSKEFMEESKELDKSIAKAEEELLRLKGGWDK